MRYVVNQIYSQLLCAQTVLSALTLWVFAAQRAWLLAHCAYPLDRTSQRLKHKLRWAFVSAFKPRLTMGWFAALEGTDMKFFAETNPRLFFKPMRVYMSTQWNKQRRIKVLLDTYRIIRSHKQLQESLYIPEGVELATLALEGGSEAKIVLGKDEGLRKEGELVASLRTSEGAIQSIAFSLDYQADGTLALYIGCVQGKYQNSAKVTAKAMHGLRPKALMVLIAQEIASALGAKDLFGVGNGIQAHQRKHLIQIPFLHDITFDYDSLWLELGGEPTPDKWFRLPLKHERRTHETIKANKRSMYRRRYEMMDSLSLQIRSTLLP